MNCSELVKRVSDGLVSERKHPDVDLWIYNYTPKTQYSGAWDEYTLNARGLILDRDGNIHSKPFPKFFNLSEHLGGSTTLQLPPIPNEPYLITNKLDGSLGISYFIDGEMFLATRGSFSSDQALVGTKILHEQYLQQGYEFDPRYTYLFEILYPENRIVVDYNGLKDVVLLAVLDKDGITHREIFNSYPFPKVEIFEPVPLKELGTRKIDNFEGFVVEFDSGMRVKVKLDEYVYLHRLLTQLTPKSIWDLLRQNKPLDELLEIAPDETYDWVQDQAKGMRNEFEGIKAEAHRNLTQIPKGPNVTRKEQAAIIKELPNPHLVFALLDDKPVDEKIWKMVEPSGGERPNETFRV